MWSVLDVHPEQLQEDEVHPEQLQEDEVSESQEERDQKKNQSWNHS